MLTNDKIQSIKQLIQSDDRFQSKITEAISYTGKESGHSYASPMEDLVREILIEKLGAKKSSKDRSLADVYLDDNLINVKFGSPKMQKSGKPKYGQPNMCAMKRIMKNFYQDSTIDSYYIIKVNLNAGNYSIHVFDMLDYIDYLTWNSGTGQIMLKENEFYKDVDTFVPNFTLEEKKTKIKALYDFGCEKHILLRISQYLKDSGNSERFKEELKKFI
jgi:hypothetical protein